MLTASLLPKAAPQDGAVGNPPSPHAKYSCCFLMISAQVTDRPGPRKAEVQQDSIQVFQGVNPGALRRKEGTVSDHATDEAIETQEGLAPQCPTAGHELTSGLTTQALVLRIWAGDLNLPGGKENPGPPAAAFLNINSRSLSSQASPGSKTSPAIRSVALTPWSLLFLVTRPRVGERVTTLLHPVPRGSHIFSCTRRGTTLGRGVPAGRLRCSEQK